MDVMCVDDVLVDEVVMVDDVDLRYDFMLPIVLSQL